MRDFIINDFSMITVEFTRDNYGGPVYIVTPYTVQAGTSERVQAGPAETYTDLLTCLDVYNVPDGETF